MYKMTYKNKHKIKTQEHTINVNFMFTEIKIKSKRNLLVTEILLFTKEIYRKKIHLVEIKRSS